MGEGVIISLVLGWVCNSTTIVQRASGLHELGIELIRPSRGRTEPGEQCCHRPSQRKAVSEGTGVATSGVNECTTVIAVSQIGSSLRRSSRRTWFPGSGHQGKGRTKVVRGHYSSGQCQYFFWLTRVICLR